MRCCVCHTMLQVTRVGLMCFRNYRKIVEGGQANREKAKVSWYSRMGLDIVVTVVHTELSAIYSVINICHCPYTARNCTRHRNKTRGGERQRERGGASAAHTTHKMLHSPCDFRIVAGLSI